MPVGPLEKCLADERIRLLYDALHELPEKMRSSPTWLVRWPMTTSPDSRNISPGARNVLGSSSIRFPGPMSICAIQASNGPPLRKKKSKKEQSTAYDSGNSCSTAYLDSHRALYERRNA